MYLEQKFQMPTERLCAVLGAACCACFHDFVHKRITHKLDFLCRKFKFMVRPDIGGCVSITINLFRLCASKPKVDMQNPGDALLDLSQQ